MGPLCLWNDQDGGPSLQGVVLLGLEVGSVFEEGMGLYHKIDWATSAHSL